MATSTDETKRSETVNKLLVEGFKIYFSNENVTFCAKPASASCFHLAQVDNEGNVNRETLEQYLWRTLNLPT